MFQRTVTNFGRNLAFTPREIYSPQSEAELLAVLNACRDRRVRAIGRLHSWSAAPVADEMLIDMRQMHNVTVEQRAEGTWVTVGAGCQIKRLLSELEQGSNVTLPSVGLITEQSVAGAISTGTHGSGKHSLSHYIAEVRIATYDPATGEAIIRVISEGAELQAARCSLGALGVVVSVGLWARAQYRVEEHFKRYDAIDEVLAAEEDYPLQQFFLIPWSWDYFAQHRREVIADHSRLATLYRWYFFLVFDIAFHLTVRLLSRVLRHRWFVRGFYRWIAPLTVIRGWKVVDTSQKMLVMEHELFRHIEIEVFVQRSRLTESLSFVEQFLKHCDGDASAISPATQTAMQAHGLQDDLDRLCGGYTHRYQICVRKVLPDDTLISMSSGAAEPSYALSFISYERPTQRQGFQMFAQFLCRSMSVLFDGRPHWGKVCPLTAMDADRLYQELSRFREICRTFDPSGRFRNDWLDDVVFGLGGLSPANAAGDSPS
ncbi:MAG: FAD-binding protein [Planctomycetota bacterium]|nr:FAD-binding protein [Planctomycetota bacterium]